MELTNINVIKALLGRHGFRFSKSMGQNFLIESWVPQEIADECMADENTVVLEVGPGIGCLTTELATRSKAVLSVELDRSLEPILAETMSEHDNVEIFFADALKTDLKAVLDERFPDTRRVVCANLPYNITTPAIAHFVESGAFDYITIMIQKEVAKRLCAKPSTSDYGAFSIYTQWHTEPEILFDVERTCFMPEPKVTSSVVRLKLRKKPPYEVLDEGLFFRLVRASFNQRRKTLLNGVAPILGTMDKAGFEAILIELGINPKIRGEALGLEEFAKISNKMKEILG